MQMIIHFTQSMTVYTKFLTRFSDNQMKSNPDKYRLFLNNSFKKKIKIGDFEITNSTQEKLLQITIDNN